MKDKIRRRKIFMRVLLWSSVSAIASAMGYSLAFTRGISIPYMLRYIPEISVGVIVGSLIVIGCSYGWHRKEQEEGQNSE